MLRGNLAGWLLGVTLLSTIATGGLVNLDQDDIVKVGILLAVASAAVWALERPLIAIVAVPVVAAFDRTVTVLGLELHTTGLALLVFSPAFLRVRARSSIPRYVSIAGAAFFLSALIASALAADVQPALSYFATWVLAAIYFSAILGLASQIESLIRILANEISALGALTSTLGLLQSVGIYTIVGPPYVSDRIDSSFGWYTVFANFAAVATLVSLSMALHYLQQRNLTAACLLAAAAGINLTGTIFSLSRGALLCLAVGAIVVVSFQVRSAIKAVAAVAGTSAIAGLAIAATPTNILLDLQARLSAPQGGDILRTQLQAAGLRVLSSNPLGIGYGNFARAAREEGALSGRTLFHAHQLFVQMALDFGWLAAGSFVAVFGWATVRCIRSSARSATMAQVGFLAASLGSFSQGFGDYLYYESAPVVLTVISLAGVVWRPESRAQSPTSPGERGTQLRSEYSLPVLHLKNTRTVD